MSEETLVIQGYGEDLAEVIQLYPRRLMRLIFLPENPAAEQDERPLHDIIGEI